jgi:hypothetical protein
MIQCRHHDRHFLHHQAFTWKSPSVPIIDGPIRSNSTLTKQLSNVFLHQIWNRGELFVWVRMEIHSAQVDEWCIGVGVLDHEIRGS